MSEFDLAVIGSGPGGYVCAIRASQLGMKVAVIEKRATHGGTCLNVGCIPSKALLYASEKFHEAGNGLADLGIKLAKPKLDLAAMMAFKDDGVKGNTDGIAFLFKKNKITVFTGTGVLRAAGTVEVSDGNGGATPLSARHIVIATGSEPALLPGIDIDEERVVTSTGALSFPSVPERLVVIGGGVIGLELGSVWQRLGAEVTVIEYLDRLLPGMDGEVAKQFERILKKQGLKFLTGHKVTGVDKSGNKLKVAIEAVKDAKQQTLDADAALVAIGRVPYTRGLGLEALGVRTDSRGRIEVGERFETSVAGIYAIGDVIKGPMLAHKAEDEGMALAEILAGQHGHVNYGTIPGIVYTWPEVAAIGRSEEELKQAGIDYKIGKFPFSANGRARVSHGTEGFVKILADARTDRVLGVHIIGANASELIHEAAVLMDFGGSAEDLARICHAHPTLAEAVREAALATDKRAIHI